MIDVFSLGSSNACVHAPTVASLCVWQESSGEMTKWSTKLASYSKGKNSARDFFKQTPLPLDSGSQSYL